MIVVAKTTFFGWRNAKRGLFKIAAILTAATALAPGGVAATEICCKWSVTDSHRDNLETTKQMTSAEGVENSRSTCGVNLVVEGGRFSPDVCRFEIRIAGPSCGEPNGCKPYYAIVFKTSSPNPDEIRSVILSNVSELKSGLYRFDSTGQADFGGQLIDKGAVARHLLRGEISLDIRSDDEIYISCDLSFENNIKVQGSGLIDVKRVVEP